ncbi:ZRT1 [[Candida] subhashii]|uniref:ZRT1 n=1 Tax=[Candida] subhashii TaxID=561895 RepID=A0A8J5UQ54_9ASCO|nr:ZRT1 [[Candida] subhashii]KAG7664501.1 ZRT1 [[Candida] subhashii]
MLLKHILLTTFLASFVVSEATTITTSGTFRLHTTDALESTTGEDQPTTITILRDPQETHSQEEDHDHEDHDHEEEEDHDHDHEEEEEGHDHNHEEFSVTGCHFHDKVQYCLDPDGVEGQMVPAPTDEKTAPTSYSGCHAHGEEIFCINDGQEVQFVTAGTTTADTTSSCGRNCHFHAGVEHCVDDDETTGSCERVDRDYNIKLRIGLLFVVLVTSALGVFGPMFLKSLFNLSMEGIIILMIKQFGTGVIISTALVHLMTHAALMWSNSCLTLHYEATGTALTMAGLFVAFIVEYVAHRLLIARANKQKQIQPEEPTKDDTIADFTSISSADQSLISIHGISSKGKLSVMIMECGIVFHSILIGVVLVVAGDSYFITLFIVIVFHQFFEGLALGSRITEMKNTSTLTRLIMGAIFALITPIGMAIGIGTLHTFNGNDPSTLIALGTLDSFSAGVLLWTGLIEMWSQDWMHGYLSNAPIIKTLLAMASLMGGMILMSVLGKWA